MYMETYYFSIQFVIYLVGAAVLAISFVIVFDIGWVVARFMIARVTFVQENNCRSCQRFFDISKLPRKCALCTFYYCRKCSFQTRIIPGYAQPQHVCGMCMLQSRQSIINELEEFCGAGSRKNRAVVGMVRCVLEAIQASRSFNLALQKYEKFVNAEKKRSSRRGASAAVSPIHNPGKEKSEKQKPKKTKKSKKDIKRIRRSKNKNRGGRRSIKDEPEFEVHVTRFSTVRIYAELRETVGYLWQESLAESQEQPQLNSNVSGSGFGAGMIDDGFGGVLQDVQRKDPTLKDLLRHAVRELLKALDDRAILHRFTKGLTRHYTDDFLHTEYEALRVQTQLLEKMEGGSRLSKASSGKSKKKHKHARSKQYVEAELAEIGALARVKKDSSDLAFYREFLRRVFTADWWVAMAKVLSSYADSTAETRRTAMQAMDNKAQLAFRSTFQLVTATSAITDDSRRLLLAGIEVSVDDTATSAVTSLAKRQNEHRRLLVEALQAFWVLPPAQRSTYFSSQCDIACRAWYESLLGDHHGITPASTSTSSPATADGANAAPADQAKATPRKAVGETLVFKPNMERWYFDKGLCRVAFRQKGREITRDVRIVVFKDFFAVFSEESLAERESGGSDASKAHLAHLLFLFFFKEVDLLAPRDAAPGVADITENDIVVCAYDLEFQLVCYNADGKTVDEDAHGKLRDLFQLLCIDRNRLCELHPNESSFPVRRDCQARLYINGAEYFDDLAHAIQGAQHTIMIADWCISPFVYLMRPHAQRDPARAASDGYSSHLTGMDPAFRLDNLLQTKAAQGVQVYILLFKELSLVLDLQSEEAEAHFKKLHTNIHVVRHCPSKLFDRTGVSKSWSHHQKFVAIDNKTAFVGGIDICAGRFDTHRHPLFDPLPPFLFPAADYHNPQIVTDCNKVFKDAPFPPVEDLYHDIRESVDHDSRPKTVQIRRGRLRSNTVKNDPTHASALQRRRTNSGGLMEGGTNQRDRRGTVVASLDLMDTLQALPTIPRRGTSKLKKKIGPKSVDVNNNNGKPRSSSGTLSRGRVGSGQNAGPVERKRHPPMPRMPWHDIHSCVYGSAAADVVENFIQRWNAHNAEDAEDAKHLPIWPRPFFNVVPADVDGRGARRPSMARVVAAVSTARRFGGTGGKIEWAGI